jgi:hypothetical protein
MKVSVIARGEVGYLGIWNSNSFKCKQLKSRGMIDSAEVIITRMVEVERNQR